MPKFQVTSPSGSSYEITVPEGDENLPDFQEKLKRQVAAYEQTYAQSGASAFGSGALQGLTSVVAEPIRGAGELFGVDSLTSLGEELAGTAKYTAPISPLMEDSWAAQGGQALGQGVGQLGLALASGGAVGALGKGLSAAAKAKAVQAAVLGPAFFAGAAGGADESRRLGLEEGSAEDIANKLLYGGSELLSESIFGLGSKAFSRELVSDAPRALLRGAKTTAIGRGAMAIGQEAVEEPIAGGLQDISSRIAVEFGGQGDFLGSTTENGAELRNPFDVKARLTEAALGAIGAGPFGVRAAMQGDSSVDEVRAYRSKVNLARKDGSIKAADQGEIDALDTKAKDFLELEGVPLMRNAAQSVLDDTAQGVVELKAIINDTAAAPAVRAAAQVKLERFKEQGKRVVEQTDKFLAGDISLADLRTSVVEYDNLNPFSVVNQEKQLAAAEAARSAAPVTQTAQANSAAGNTATAAALLDTQAARQRAGALRAQARADRKAPVTQQPAQAPAQTPQANTYGLNRPLAKLTDEELELRIQESGRLANETAVEGSPDAAFFTKASENYRAEKARRAAATTQAPAAAPASTQAPAPAVSSREQAAREVEASYDEAVRAALPQVDTLVNESLPALVNQVSQAMADGDFETASNLSDQLTRESARLQRFDAPEIQRAFGRTLTPEQQDDFKRKRAAAEQLAKDVQRTVAARAKSSGTPVGTAVAERMAPKPTQAELPLDTPPVTPQGEVPTTATEGPPMSRDSSTPQTAATETQAPPVPAAVKAQLDQITFGFRQLVGANAGKAVKKILIDREGTVYDVDDAEGHPKFVRTNLPQYIKDGKPDVRQMVADGWYWGSVSKDGQGNYAFIDGATEGWSPPTPTTQTPAVDEFGLPVAEAPADQAAIDAAFAELETQREAPAPAETPQEAPTPAETPPATATEPVVSELDAIDAELAANKIKREQARQRARAAYGRLGFFGGDPVEQAIADGRVWKANVELGYLLLKKGYVRFKIWAREYLRQNADDPSSMRLLRRIYRMLRDDPASAASLLNVPEDQIASLSGGMDASINNVSLAPEPQIKDPGYFGAIENVLDWAGNTTFFEGRESVPGGGKSHRIYLDEVIEDVTYDVVYRFEGKTYRTGDRVSRHGGEWLFGYGVGAGPRAARFRLYSTTQLTASFAGGESASRVAEDTRRNIIAFNQIAQFDASGRLAFSRSDEVARWISSVRYEKDDFRFPVNGTILDNEIAIKLAGTEDVVGRFTLQDGVWVFGSGESLTKSEQAAQDSFAVVGFELEDSNGTTSANTPAKVVAAWPSKSKTYNPLDGFGPAPISPDGKRVKPKASEPAFKNYADLEAWITAKRMRQGHSLDINKMRRYVRERGPRSFRKYVDKALASAEKAYATAYPAEQTSLPVFKARDNKNIGVQYARMVQDTAGSRPLFTNNVFETAVQLNMGLKVFVPEGFAGAVHPLIQVNPTTREVISASDASGKVSKEGDHLAVRQRDPNVLAKSEARMATEDEMNEALLDDFDFVDGLPKAANEDSMLKEASRKFASMRFSSSASKPFDRAMVDLVATANLFAETRLVTLIPAIEETGYSKDGVILDPAKLPQAVAAVRAFIESRRQQAKEQRATLQELGESTREVEEISVLPDRLEGLVKSAAKAMVLRNNAGAINYGAYWNRALRRVMQRYNTRINSGFAAPVATTQYNEEGSEQIDPNDEQQVAAALAAGDISMTGSSLTFDEVVEETDEPEGGFVNPQKAQGKAVQLDLFGKETTEEEEPDAEDTAPVVEEDEPELAENNDLGVALNTEVAAEPELTDAERFQISPEIAAKRNRGQRSTMRRILRDLPVNLRNAVFNSPTTDRFDVVLTTYYSMRAALIRSGIIRSEERPTFREAMDLVFKNQNKVKGLDKLFSNSVKEALGQMSRAHAKAPGIPKARAAKAAADALGLVDGDVQSAIDALTRAASLQEIDFGTRMLAKKIAALRGVSALRGFSMIPMESARGTMLRDRAIINISPSGSTTELIETLMHEFVHLSTEQAFQDLESGTADEAVVRADEELTVLREELARYAYQNMGSALFNEYAQAFDNNSEFLSYLFSDSKFNAWVSARPQSFLIRVANAIRKLLGLKVPANTTLDKAWRAVLLMSDRPAMFAQTAEAVDRDALEIILMSIDQQGPGTEARNLMAGANARRLPEALKDSFSKARDMDAAGENKDKIRQETGWYRAPTDKQWRWEINDKDSKLNVALFQNMEVEGSVVGSVTDLEILFSHPELYKAYPELRTVQVRKSPASDPNRGSYGPAGFTINESVSPEQARLTLLHEIQHWIQRYEGFFRGTSLDTVRSLIKDGTLTSADMFSMAGMAALDVNFVQAIYYRWPGELEARMVSSRADLTDEERRQVPVGPNYPVNAAVVKLRTLAANGGIQASYEVADTGIEVSTEFDLAGWYDSRSDTIKINPDVIAEETQFMSPRASREYMTRLMLHENTHRSDAHTDTTAARAAYSNAMSEADFEWIAKHYYVDPARREFALGRTPGMTQEQKVKERQILVLEHRVAMIELAKKGETLDQFAIFAASNPGLVSHIKRLLMRFVRLLAARVRNFHYQGSARDLQGVMETLNYIEDIAPRPSKAARIAELQRRVAALKAQMDNLELPLSSNYLFEDLASKLAVEDGNTPTEESIQYWTSEISMALRQATRASDDPVRSVGTTLTQGAQGLTALSNDDSVRRHIRRYSDLYDRLKTRYPAELIKLSAELNEFETSGRGALAVQLGRVESELDDLILGGEDSPTGESIIAGASSVAVPIMSRRLGTYKVGGWATTGFLNQETAEQQRVRDAKLRAMQARVQMHKDDLARAVKKEYTSRGLANPESLINEALGSIENPVNPQQLAVAEQLRTRAVRNAVSKFLSQQNLARSQSDPAQGSLIRENARTAYQSELIQARKIKERYLNKVESDWVTAAKAKQAAAFASLSPETSTVARAIRDDIDAMQQQLIQSGVLGPKTAARVTKTFGIYLTRSYQVYNENIVTVSGVKRNLWNEFLRDSKDPKSVAILDAARAAIFEDAVKEKAKELKLANTRARNPIGPFQSLADRDVAIKAAQRANPVLDSATALSRARAMLQSNGGVEVETMLEKYLEMGENMDSDTDVLKRRDAIHPAIQALWGVYEQNEYNAFNTMMKINALLANQSLFEEIYKHGKASGYIFDKEGVVVDGQRTVPLGGTGTQANRNRFGILAGKYGPAELKAGLEEVFGGNTQSTSSLWNFLRATTGYAMATKTKYSIQGIARNFVGNIMFAGINLNLHKLFDPRARGVVARQLGLKVKNKTEYDNYIRRLIELRVVSESAYEFRDLTREFSQEALGWVNRATKGRKSLSAVVETVRKLDKVAGVAHQGADDFWKVLSFEGELARVKKWEPNLTQEQAEQKAAWKIRNTMPTYTEAFYFIKRLRQQPFIAPFITFTAEVYRTTFGTLRVGLNEIAEGKANGNQGQMIAGLARISNLVMAVGFMPTLMAMLGKAAFGAGEDDEEDLNPGAGEEALRRFVPEYMRKNSIMRFGSGKWEEQIYMDASYLIPHDVLGKVLRSAFDAYMKPETIGVAQKAVDAGMAFMEQVLEPVTNDQLFFGSVMQAKFNYNQAYDRKIYKDTDTGWEAAQAVIAHIYTSALEPGTVRTGRLIMEAADGVVRDGMKMEVGNEMLSVGGIKKRTVMLETRFARNADGYKKTMGEAATYITTPLQSNSTVEDADIKRGYDRANEVRMANLREVRRDYLAATYLGMPQAKAKQLLLDSQLSDDDVASVVGNFYTPYQVSDQVFNKALEKSKAFGQDRVRLYLDAAKQYPKRQPLIPE